MSAERPTLFHNPRCSKSREALRLLEEAGHEPEVVRYLDTPPSREELVRLLEKLGLAPAELLRRGEKIFRELGLGGSEVTDDDRLRAMVEHPILIERPIAIVGDRAVVGRPPERVLELAGE